MPLLLLFSTALFAEGIQLVSFSKPEKRNSAAINAAIQQCQWGDTIRLPAGGYDLREAVRMKSGIKLLGAGSNLKIMEQIHSYLEGWSGQALPKSPVGKAVTYALGQCAALNRYVDHGILSIDNNLAERVLRMVVIGRKNWLFAGSDNGGTRAAVIYSLVASCKLCGLDPFAYLRDVIDRVSAHPAKMISQLIPSNWKSLQASLETGGAFSNT